MGIARVLGLIRGELQRLGLGSVELPVAAEGRIETGGFMAGAHAMGTSFMAGAHAMGTTWMGASARNGVVDADFLLRGVPNLYVASSSVFPTSGFAAPTLTIVALALRICDGIERNLR